MEISIKQFRSQCGQLAIRDRHHEVLDLMQQAPLEIIQADEDLAFWHALCLLSTVRYVDGKQAADEFIRRYATADNALALGRSHLLRSHLCIMDGDTDASYNHELQVVSILPENAYHERLRSWATIDTMAGHIGDNARIEMAAEELAEIRNHLPFDQSWWYSFVVPNRADILAKRGLLTEAETLLLAQLPSVPQEDVAVFKLRLAVIALEHQNPVKASKWLEDVAHDGPATYWSMEAYLIASQVARLLGDPDQALVILQDGMAKKTTGQIRAELFRAQLQLAELWIQEGEIDLADAWMRLASKSLDPWPRTFGHPIPNLIQAELAMAKGDWPEAIHLLETLRAEGVRRNHAGLLVGIYAHLAHVYVSLDDKKKSHEMVRLAMHCGEGGIFTRSYTVFGLDVRTILSQELPIGIKNKSNNAQEQRMISDREGEVLQMVAEGMRNAEIADSLFLSISTVKNHLANIFRRLGVANRRDAVKTARRMGLLEEQNTQRP